MVAIITDYFKREFVQHVFDDVSDSASNYYIGIGRSQDWNATDTPTIPTNTAKDERDFRLNMQSVKKIEDVSFVAPRYNWASGSIYTSYNNALVGYSTNPHYVITDNNSVYICLQQAKSASGAAQPSTTKPTGSLTVPFKTIDGYVWKFLYTLSAADANRFLSANYIPVKKILSTDGSSSANDIEQESIQNAAIAGQIGSIAITSGGTGYTSAPAVTILGDGVSAEATATVSSGAVVKIDIRDSDSTVLNGNGYQFANIVLSGGGGSGAAARANIAPRGGFGADSRIDLKSTAVMFNAKPDADEGGDFIIGQDFRQVGLIKNILAPDTDSDYTAATGSALNQMTLTTVTSSFTADKIIRGTTSDAVAYVDRFDSDTIYYHQTLETGFTAFEAGETVSEDDGAGSGTINNPLLSGDINKFSGEVFYIDNRASIERSAGQTEDLKIVIQL